MEREGVGEGMKLENQVCSLELAKRLKELGVKQESLWWWECHYGSEPELRFVKKGKITETGDNWYYSAFTVAELGEMLPSGYGSFKDTLTNTYYCGSRGFLVQGTQEFPHSIADTEANARAKMLIHL